MGINDNSALSGEYLSRRRDDKEGIDVRRLGLDSPNDRSAKFSQVVTEMQGRTLRWPAGVFTVLEDECFLHGDVSLVGENRNSGGLLVKMVEPSETDLRSHGVIKIGITGYGNAAVRSTWTGQIKGLQVNVDPDAIFTRLMWLFNAKNVQFVDSKFDLSAALNTANLPRKFGLLRGGTNGAIHTQQEGVEGLAIRGNFAVAKHIQEGSEGFSFTNAKHVDVSHNYMSGFGDDVIASHFGEYVNICDNHIYAVDGRVFFNNTTGIIIARNHVHKIADRDGNYSNSASLIKGDSQNLTASQLDSRQSNGCQIIGNHLYASAELDASAAEMSIATWISVRPAQEGFKLCDNVMHKDTTSGEIAISLQTLDGSAANTGLASDWTGPAGNIDESAGGQIRLHSGEVTGNMVVGKGGPLLIRITPDTGRPNSEVVGPILVDRNHADEYLMLGDGIRFGENNTRRGTAGDGYRRILGSAIRTRTPAIEYDFDGLDGSHTAAAPLTLTVGGKPFVARRSGRVIGGVIQFDAAAPGANPLYVRLNKSGTASIDTRIIGSGQVRDWSPYLKDASWEFAEGDALTFEMYSTSAGLAVQNGRIGLVVQYD